jgi:crotonobetainyl-CoA:carnitine CoA-transferase CaiB-like acyl-CoA transferase
VKGTITLAAPGVTLSETPLEWDMAPPLLGEHSRSVLSSLGYSDGEIESLLASGLLAEPNE